MGAKHYKHNRYHNVKQLAGSGSPSFSINSKMVIVNILAFFFH